MPLTIETDVPITQTRGRPASDEHMALLTMPIKASFVSHKRRETLYQIARDMGVRVSILPAGEDAADGWRVWKLSNQVPPAQRIRKRVKALKKKRPVSRQRKSS